MKIQANFFGSLRLGDLLKINQYSIFKELAGSQMAPLEGGVVADAYCSNGDQLRFSTSLYRSRERLRDLLCNDSNISGGRKEIRLSDRKTAGSTVAHSFISCLR